MKAQALRIALGLALAALAAAAGDARADREDPLGGFRFRVEIDGIVRSDVQDVFGFASETEVIRFREAGAPLERKLPGQSRFSNLVLRRAFNGDLEWWEWRQRVVDGTVDRRSASILLLNEAREEVVRFNLYETWPAAYRLFPLQADGNDVLIEELELAVERIELAR